MTSSRRGPGHSVSFELGSIRGRSERVPHAPPLCRPVSFGGAGACRAGRRSRPLPRQDRQNRVVGVVGAVVLVGRVVGVVVDGERGREEVGEVDAVEVCTKEAERGEDIGLRVVVEEGEDDWRGGECGIRLIGGGCAAWETRAAMSSVMEVLPDEGYPAMRVSLPRGMRLGQSQSGGCWMRNLKGWRPAPCAPEEL